MTIFAKGDVVLVSLPFTNLSGTKARPAVVVSDNDYNAKTPDIIIASITSNLGAIRHPGDHPISDWRGAGLLKPSLAQMKLQTITHVLVRRTLGSLSTADLSMLDQGLRQALGLPEPSTGPTF